MKKKLIIAAFSLFLLSSFCLAQEAELRDEFGSINCEELMARIDPFAGDLQSDMNRSFGYIVVYEGKYDRHVYNNTGDSKIITFLPMQGEANIFGEKFDNT